MIHIFDVDFTVIKKPTTWYYLREALREGIISFSQVKRLPIEWIKYKLKRPNMDFIEDAVKHLAGIDQQILEKTAHTCFERRTKANIYTDAAILIKEIQQRGEIVVFATSSITTMIQPLEKYFGIEGSIATTLEFCCGKTTGKIAGYSCFGPKKKTAVEIWLKEKNINPKEVCFYTDSYTDLPLMEFCGRPVAVNPDRVLAKEAKKQGWEILRFKKTLGVSRV